MKTFFYSGVSGLLMGMGVIYPVAWILSIIGVVSFIHICRSSDLSLRRSFFCGWLAWTVKALVCLWWFWSVYPLDWLGLASHTLQLIAIGFYWLTAGLYLGIGGGILAIFVVSLRQYATQESHVLLALPVVWVLAELVSSFTFSLFTWAPGIVPNIGFSFGYIGYALSAHAGLIQFAQFGGVYMLSFLTVLSAGSSLWFLKRYSSVQVLGLTIFTGAVLFGWQSVVENITPIAMSENSLAVINTRYSPEQLSSVEGKELRANELRAAVIKAHEQQIDFVLLPEDASVTASFGTKEALLPWLGFLVADPAIVIDSGTVRQDGVLHMRASLHVPDKSTVYSLDKQYLVPQGEFFPYLYSKGLGAIGFGDLVSSISTKSNYRPGPLTRLETEMVLPALLFCSESVSPYGAKRALMQNTANTTEPPFIFHPVSHAWFHEPTTMWNQLDQMLKIQAIWTDVPIVSAGNLTPGKVYYQNGLMKEIEPTVTEENWEIGYLEL